MKPTPEEWKLLQQTYRSSSAIRTELDYLRRQWPRLETEAQRQDNLCDRAMLAQLLLTADR